MIYNKNLIETHSKLIVNKVRHKCDFCGSIENEVLDNLCFDHHKLKQEGKLK